MDTNRASPRVRMGAAALAVGLSLAASPAPAQWVRQNEQFYLPAEHNWAFRENYRAADRLFNAFDYGHGILYEELYTRPGAPAERLERKEYDFITRKLLVKPPRVPLEEAAIEKEYAKLVPEAKLMFEWAHLLHRQIYDVLADERLSRAEKDAAVAEVVRYYRSRPDLAFSSRPKSMELMEGQYYSTAFREKYPKFNGLIWAYHWLQVGLYEPLLVGGNLDERQRGVLAAVTRFWQMLEDAPANMPRVMPMTPAIAPEFARRYPEAAVIFDNLHGLHDVISDILASPKVPRDRKREEILRAAARYRDDTSFVMSEPEWLDMARMMGLENQGGPVTGFLEGFPEPTVERGAVMAGMDHSAHGAPADTGRAEAGHEGMHHGVRPTDTGGMLPPPREPMTAGPGPAASAEPLHELHLRLLQDSVIHRRIMADTALHRLHMEMLEALPAEERERLMRMMHGDDPHAGHRGAAAEPSAPAKRAPAAKPAPKKAPAAKPAPKKAPAAKPAPKPDPHAGHRRPPPPPARRDTAHVHHPGGR